MARYRSSGNSVEVECYGEAYLDDFETEALIRELRKREHSAVMDYSHELDDIKKAIVEGRKADALALLDRVLDPKYRSLEECETLFAKRK